MIFNSWTLGMLPRLGTVRNLRGMYPTWEQAAARGSGYSTTDIYERSLRAARAVRDGSAAWQRDSVLFPRVAYSWPVMAELAYQRALGASLDVLDYGGGFGSSYLQYRSFAPADSQVTWMIVELPKIAMAGISEFSSPHLQFTATIPDRQQFRPDVVLLSGVLQYLPDAESVMRTLLALKPRSIIIDRTPVSSLGFYSVQVVPLQIYKAAYPIRVFEQNGFSQMFEDMILLQDFPSYCDNPKKLFRGRIYRRRT